MTDGPESFLTCTVCFSPYNRAENVPMVGSCGHTLCSQCVKSLYPPDCPICRAVESFSRPTKNFLACDFIDQDLTQRTGIDVSVSEPKTAPNPQEISDPSTGPISRIQEGNPPVESRSLLTKFKRLLGKENNGVEQQPPSGNTILILGGLRKNKEQIGAVLSIDRQKWIKLKPEKLPCVSNLGFGGGLVNLNDEIYLFKGNQNPKEFYKLDDELKWQRLADLNIARSRITRSCLAWNGFIWVFGGRDGNSRPLKSVERYDPKTNKWTRMPDMNRPRSRAAAAIWNDGIIVTGGLVNDKNATNSVECFFPNIGCWLELPQLPTILSSHSLVSYKNRLIAIGGEDDNPLVSKKVWSLNLGVFQAKWRPFPSLKSHSAQHCGIVFNREIYAIGGCQNVGIHLNRVEIFNGEYWRNGPSLPYKGFGMYSVIIPQILAARLCNYK